MNTSSAFSKKSFLVVFVISISLLSLSSCKEESDEVDSYKTEDFLLRLPPNTYQAKNLEGIVGFCSQDSINQYIINVSILESIDGQITGFVSNMPSDFQTEGLNVIFSGDYSTALDTPSVLLGGQQIYALELSSIRLK